MRMPGRTGVGGGAAFASEATASVSKAERCRTGLYAPMPLGSLESTRVLLLLRELDLEGWSPTIVEVDEERLKVFASGARCVSFSSGPC